MMMMGSTKRVVGRIIQPATYNPSKPRPWRDMLASRNPKALISNLVKSKNADSGEDPLIAGDQLPSDGNNVVLAVPKGFLAVYVGVELRRFVIPASYLSMPDFAVLMDRAAEEFGYQQQGGLKIPCEEDEFEDILSRCSAVQQAVAKAKPKKD